ncbi:MAG: lysoplasmalogenase [Erysipelotrichaceae bacterium]|nr:lysoplasmalogenase [Erysipelotrichaceae bacterium]
MIKYLLIIAGALLQLCFIITEHREDYVKAVILKGLASLMFVITGFLGYRNSGSGFGRLIFIGLALGMLGDILLNLRFVFPENGQKIFLLGIVAFLAGHILYLAALIPQAQHLSICLIIGALIAAALLIYIFKTMEVKLAFKIFGVVYLGAVIIMTAVAIGNAIALPSKNNVMYAIGAIAFALSDIVLIFNTFGSSTRFSLRVTNLSLYYLGQALIALSLFFI